VSPQVLDGLGFAATVIVAGMLCVLMLLFIGRRRRNG